MNNNYNSKSTLAKSFGLVYPVQKYFCLYQNDWSIVVGIKLMGDNEYAGNQVTGHL